MSHALRLILHGAPDGHGLCFLAHGALWQGRLSSVPPAGTSRVSRVLGIVSRCSSNVKTIVQAAVLFAPLVTAQAQYGRVIHVSPDEKLKAVVVPTFTQERGFHEHRVEIRTTRGECIAVKDHSSGDHEHGQGVLVASWTPDSRFFVSSVSSSGGHGAGHFTTCVFVRESGNFFYLDDLARPFVMRPITAMSPGERADQWSGCGASDFIRPSTSSAVAG